MKPIPLFARFVYRLLKRLLTLDVTWLMLLDRNHAKTASDVEIASVTRRLLTPTDIERYSSDPDAQLSEEFSERAKSGVDFCVGVFVENELASYAWFALESIDAEQNRGGHPATGVGLKFPPHMAFMYKGYTLPAFRGRGLYREVPRAALELLAHHGVTAILSTADCSNSAALTSCARLGFQPIGRVWVAGVGPFVWRRRPAAARPHRIQPLAA